MRVCLCACVRFFHSTPYTQYRYICMEYKMCMYVCMHACMYVCMYVYTHLYWGVIHTCIADAQLRCMYVHIHTRPWRRRRPPASPGVLFWVSNMLSTGMHSCGQECIPVHSCRQGRQEAIPACRNGCPPAPWICTSRTSTQTHTTSGVYIHTCIADAKIREGGPCKFEAANAADTTDAGRACDHIHVLRYLCIYLSI